MVFKRIILTVFVTLNILCIASEKDTEQKSPMTVELAKKLIATELEKEKNHINVVQYIDQFMNPNAHSKEGLQKIVNCVNNFDECDHPVILQKKASKNHKNNKKLEAEYDTCFDNIKDHSLCKELILKPLYEEKCYNHCKKYAEDLFNECDNERDVEYKNYFGSKGKILWMYVGFYTLPLFKFLDRNKK